MTDNTAVRLDKWLWAARFYKTRSLAAAAIASGKVRLNGDRAKAGRILRVGDSVRVRIGPYEYVIVVRALAARRGPAKHAAALYEEASESRSVRERLVEQLRLAPSVRYHGKGRPTKKERREIERLKGP